jgi:hypothetical protein
MALWHRPTRSLHVRPAAVAFLAAASAVQVRFALQCSQSVPSCFFPMPYESSFRMAMYHPYHDKKRLVADLQLRTLAAFERRLTLTLKQNLTRLTLVPLRRETFQAEVNRLALWYNKHRPHMTLACNTPDEAYDRQRWPANRQPRFEPRPGWPRRSPCAKPVTLVKGKPGARLEFQVLIDGGRRHLLIVILKRAA